MARKTEFELEDFSYGKPFQRSTISIIGQRPANAPYVNINLIDAEGRNFVFGIQDKDLERFLVNGLKALGSKKPAFSQRYNSKIFFAKKKKRKP